MDISKTTWLNPWMSNLKSALSDKNKYKNHTYIFILMVQGQVFLKAGVALLLLIFFNIYRFYI